MGLGESIVVNDFVFCLDHGWEYCPYCTCDYRPVNNYPIEDKIADLSEYFNFDVIRSSQIL